MAIQLSGEVGRDGRPEDVAVVQALLANIRAADGRPFWTGGLDGRGGAALVAAIAAFQRRHVTVAVAGGSAELGVVRPGSRTLSALAALAMRGVEALRLAAAAPAFVLYGTDAARRRVVESRATERNVPSATHRDLSEIGSAQRDLVHRDGLAVSVRRAGLVGDRWGFQVTVDGLTVIAADARWQPVGDRQELVPAAVWRLVDAAFARAFEFGGGSGDWAGPGVYRSRVALASLAAGIDEALFVRFEVPRPPRPDTVRLASAALRLIAVAWTLGADRNAELVQLLWLVRIDDEDLAERLAARWTVMRGGITTASVRYATREQIGDYLERTGQYDRTLALVGICLQASAAHGAILDAARSLDNRPAATVTFAVILADLLSAGAANQAERLYDERRQAIAAGGTAIAGITVPPGVGRRDFLLSSFRIDPARFRVDPAAEARLLDLMQRVLELQQTGGAGADAIRDEIYRDWGRHWFLEQLLDGYRNALERITNPVNAAIRPDDRLVAYRTWVAAARAAVEVVAEVDILRGLAGARRTKSGYEDVVLDFLQSVAEDESRRAIDLATVELKRREPPP